MRSATCADACILPWHAQYTLILPASKQLPKACIRDKRGAAVCKLRRTVGVRLPADPICDAILQGLSRPLLCTSVRVQRPDSEPGSQWLADPARIRDELGSSVDFVIDAGLRAVAPSTVVDLSGPMPRLLRRGKGDWCVFCKPCKLRCSRLRLLTRAAAS
jgi:tRNA A37 threonylcarbamoyladenosine synthetase subunit TsaC/SUA5/YrdC